MEIPNRYQLDAEAAQLLAALAERQRTEAAALMGNPPDVANIPPSAWARWQQETESELAAIVLLIFIQSGTFHGAAEADATKQGRFWSQSFARDAASKIIGTTQAQLAAASQQFRTDGQGVDESLGRIFGSDRANRIAVDAVTTAQSAGGEWSVASMFGLSQDDWWKNNPGLSKSGPCPTCEALHGQPRYVWETEHPSGPPSHPGCVLPGQSVQIAGVVKAAAKSFYVGPCVEITLSNGCQFSVTENHPILTPIGFVPAGSIGNGVNVLCCFNGNGESDCVNPDNNEHPPLIEDVFASLVVSRQVASVRVPVSPEAFHGDGKFIQGDVQIVDAHCLLGSEANSHVAKESSQREFVRAGDVSSLPRDRASLSLSSGRGPTGCCDVCGGDSGQSLCIAHRVPGHLSGLFGGPSFNTCFNHSVSECVPVNAKLGSEFVFGFPVEVSANDLVEIRDFDSSLRRDFNETLNSSLTHPLIEGSPEHAHFLSQLVGVFPGGVSVAEVTEVRRFSYFGHVYDLQCDPLHVYGVNGAIVSNCVCEIVYLNLQNAEAN